MRIALVVPHIFMQRDILPRVIFSPAELAINLAEGLHALGHTVTLCTPGAVDTSVDSLTADLSLFEAELDRRGDDYLDLLKKHPLTFTTLARQVQSELLADVFRRANAGEFDIVHIYTNEEELGMVFAGLCTKPVVFTHHDPFNFLIRYKAIMPRYAQLPWISMSLAQRSGMPADTRWLGNIYHGLPADQYQPAEQPTGGYVAYLGRIIQPKGVHLAIAAVKQYNRDNGARLQLRIAGKHYAGQAKDGYWQEQIEPLIDGEIIRYEGFIGDTASKQTFLANAEALLVPSLFDEPFGMVIIEALACGTPVIGLSSGAIPEVIEDTSTGYVVTKNVDESETINHLAAAIGKRAQLQRVVCRQRFEDRFTLGRMCQEHADAYQAAIDQAG